MPRNSGNIPNDLIVCIFELCTEPHVCMTAFQWAFPLICYDPIEMGKKPKLDRVSGPTVIISQSDAFSLPD